MRIAYVAIHLDRIVMGGGVGNKIKTQMRLWQEFGHEASLFLLTSDSIDLPSTSIFQFNKGMGLAPMRLLGRETSRSRALRDLVIAVATFKPDVIYFRYGLFAFPLQDLFSIAPVIVEINSNDVAEYRTRGSFFYAMNRLTRGIILKNAAGLIPVSHEIAGLPANKDYQKPSIVLANGIDMDQYDPLQAPANENPCLVFVGTPGYAWHGVDKIITLGKRFSDLSFEVIGYDSEDFDENIPRNIRFHGFLSHDTVKEILGHADVACGSLALHRVKIMEASPLKVRETLAYGIPTLLAYTDTDLADANFDFILQIPNREDNVSTNADRIREFAFKMRGRRVNRKQITQRIDQRRKEKVRLDFFSQIKES